MNIYKKTYTHAHKSRNYYQQTMSFQLLKDVKHHVTDVAIDVVNQSSRLQKRITQLLK